MHCPALWAKLLNGGKHDPTELPPRERAIGRLCLRFGGGGEGNLSRIKRREKLTVEILPIGNDEHGRVLEFRTSGNQPCKEGHGKALS